MKNAACLMILLIVALFLAGGNPVNADGKVVMLERSMAATEKKRDVTSYSKKYQEAVQKMQANAEQADIIAMANIDDSAEFCDYDAFYMEGIVSSLNVYLKSETEKNLYGALDEKVWQSLKLGGESDRVPTGYNAQWRGWSTEKVA